MTAKNESLIWQRGGTTEQGLKVAETLIPKCSRKCWDTLP